MSGIVEALRRAASATGSTVELQSARGGDVFTQSRAAEVKDADFRMRQKWMAEHVALLSDVDAMKWAVAQKEEGNRLFRDGQLPAACDAYVLLFLCGWWQALCLVLPPPDHAEATHFHISCFRPAEADTCLHCWACGQRLAVQLTQTHSSSPLNKRQQSRRLFCATLQHASWP